MGNGNKKEFKADPHKNRPVYLPGRVGHDGSVSPPVLVKQNEKNYGPEQEKELNKAAALKEDKRKGKTVEGSTSLIHAPQPRPLLFKSWANGTLNTDHFLGPGQSFMSPLQPLKSFSLDGSSPAFIPSPDRVAAPFNPNTPPQTVGRRPHYQTPTGPLALRLQTNFNPGYYPTPVTQRYGYSQMSQVTKYERRLEDIAPQQHQMAAVVHKVPKTFNTLRDKKRKDILIDEKGVIRNVIQVTERYLPNGMPFQTVNVGAANNDALALLEGMPDVMKADFLNKNWIEIVVSLQSQEKEDAMISQNKQKDEEILKSGGDSTSQALTVGNPLPALVKVLRSLPSYFTKAAAKVVVVLQFPTATNSMIPIGPRAKLPYDRSFFSRGNSTHTISNSTEFQAHPNFVYVAQVVAELNKFTGLCRLNIILAPPANMRTPMTLPQLNCLLPFYDLDFVQWTANWKTTFMSKPEVLKDWPLEYVNGQRDRIIAERQKKIDDMVFVRKSVAPPVVKLERPAAPLRITIGAGSITAGVGTAPAKAVLSVNGNSNGKARAF